MIIMARRRVRKIRLIRVIRDNPSTDQCPVEGKGRRE
jgi:hypothetical protein